MGFVCIFIFSQALELTKDPSASTTVSLDDCNVVIAKMVWTTVTIWAETQEWDMY